MEIQQFSIVYKNDRIVVNGANGLYTLTYPGSEDILLEHGADGWYRVQQSEKHWTDHDTALIGKMIEDKDRHI